MSWDDDDFDVDEHLVQSKAPEEELTIDDIEEAERKKKEAEAAAAPKPKKQVKKKEEKKEKEEKPEDTPLLDPVAEKIRLQKLMEENDARMAADLFAGVDKAPEEIAALKAKEEEKKRKEAEKAKKAANKVQIEERDLFEEVELKTQGDVTSLLGRCLEKLEASKAKESDKLFLTHMMKALHSQLSTEDLNKVDKMLEGLIRQKKLAQAQAQSAKVGRAQDKDRDKGTKSNKASAYDLDDYADGDWGDDWDEEWWDDATAADYAPPKR